MRFLFFILMTFLAGAALIVANPTNQIGKLLQKAGLLEGMMERYSVNLVDEIVPGEETALAPSNHAQPPRPTTPTTPTTPPSPPPPQDPAITRLTELIENLENENKALDLKIRASEAQRAESNTTSGEAKRYQRDIDANDKRIAEYKAQIETAIARDNARQ